MTFGAGTRTSRWCAVYSLAPMGPLALLMVTTLHWVSPATREILILLSQFERIGSGALAHRVARRSRHQLARMLARDGLPSLKKLRMWVRLIGWTLEWEYYHISLYRSAIMQDMDPATAYRAVKKLTGLSWGVVRQRGLVCLLESLQRACRPRVSLVTTNAGASPGALVNEA